MTFMRAILSLISAFVLAPILGAQDPDPGRAVFETRCARCHGSDGNGGELGPAIRNRLAGHTDEQLTTLIVKGLPGQGMPPVPVVDADMAPLLRFLRTLQPRDSRREVVRLTARTVDGKTLDGEVLNQGFADVQLLAGDKKVHLLRR